MSSQTVTINVELMFVECKDGAIRGMYGDCGVYRDLNPSFPALYGTSQTVGGC